MSEMSGPERHRAVLRGIRDLGDDVPGVMKGFGLLHRSAITDGALSTATKELMALAIAIAVHCDGCIAFHVHDAVRAGATKAEVDETIGVAVLMGGAPSVMYGIEAQRAYDEFAGVSASAD